MTAERQAGGCPRPQAAWFDYYQPIGTLKGEEQHVEQGSLS